MDLVTACWDYDQDGDQDVYVANDMEANFLYVNDGKGNFQRMDFLLVWP